MLKTKLAPQI